MERVFITGGAGFIGAELTRKLLNKGYDVVIYDAFLNYANHFNNPYFRVLDIRLKDIKNKAVILRGDIRNQAHLFRCVNRYKPEYFVHLAAMPIATASTKFSEDAFDINLKGTRNVLEVVKDFPSIKKFIYASSSMIYGHFTKESADEEHQTQPIDVYGGTKLAGEILTKAYSRNYGFTKVIIRPSACYGPTDVNRRVSQIFIENAFKNKPLTLHNGGSAKLDFTYIEDIAEGFLLAIENEKANNETFNITAGNSRSLKEFADIIKQHISTAKIIEGPIDVTRPKRGTLDISKAKRLLGYEAKYNIEEGIKKYIDFIKENNYLI